MTSFLLPCFTKAWAQNSLLLQSLSSEFITAPKPELRIHYCSNFFGYPTLGCQKLFFSNIFLINMAQWAKTESELYCLQQLKCRPVNTLRPRQNVRHLADDTFKPIFLNENIRISIKISLKFVPKVPINNIPALVQIMAWRRPGDKPLSELMLVSLLTHICVTRPQWVNTHKVEMLLWFWVWG